MKLQFPIYLIGGPSSVGNTAWLKSKLDENEYLFVFTSEESAQQCIETCITNGPGDLKVIEVRQNEMRPILEENTRGGITWLVVDFHSSTEFRLSNDSLLLAFAGE
jgi:hypothetical protein